MNGFSCPEFVFFTGAPGSRWSGIAQILERHPLGNTSDRAPHRQYWHSEFSGHLGAYFGPGMEFDAILDDEYLRRAWADPKPGFFKLVKSHHWAYMLDSIVERFADSWVVLVWRDAAACESWWHHAGGFRITYPNYGWYENTEKMRSEIVSQNNGIEKFASRRDLSWRPFDDAWLRDHFQIDTADVPMSYDDVRIAVWRG